MKKSSNYINNYMESAGKLAGKIDFKEIENTINLLATLKKNNGRLFLLGVGGSAANCSHAVNDFRKIAHIEAYTPTDNVAELTARTNDEGWETTFIEWLKVSRLSSKDVLMVLSVGGGDLEKNVSPNIVKALEYAQGVKSTIIGIVSRDGGYTKKVSKTSILIPIEESEFITPLSESFQGIIWHLMVNHPKLKD